MTKKSSEPVSCPGCGSHSFNITGCVGYSQLYNSRTDTYFKSDMDWDADWPHYVECMECSTDATQLFRKAGILTAFFKHVGFKGGKGKLR